MFTFLLVLQAVIAAILVTLILTQRSEGGGLGVGGSSSGVMTARGQADFLTRATAFTAVAFVGLSIILAGLATQQRTAAAIDTSLTEEAAPADGGPSPVSGGETTGPEPVSGGDISLDALPGAGDSAGEPVSGSEESE